MTMDVQIHLQKLHLIMKKVNPFLNGHKRMNDDGTFANYGTNADNMISGFLAGDVAMFLQSSASSRDVIDNAPFEVGVAFLPYPENEERQGVAIGGASLMDGKR